MLIKATSVHANFKEGFDSTQLETDIEDVLKQYQLILAGKYTLPSPEQFRTDGRFYVTEQSKYDDMVKWSSAFTSLSRFMPSSDCFRAVVTVYHWEKSRIPRIRRDLTTCFMSQKGNLLVQGRNTFPSIFVDGTQMVAR